MNTPAEHGDTPDLTEQERDALYEWFNDVGGWTDQDDFRRLTQVVKSILSARSAATPDTAAQADIGPVMPIYGPAPMPGFEGCTDRNPDVCACATDEDEECAACGEIIDPGTPAYWRTEGQPWLADTDDAQDWITLSWHAACDTRRDPDTRDQGDQGTRQGDTPGRCGDPTCDEAHP